MNIGLTRFARFCRLAFSTFTRWGSDDRDGRLRLVQASVTALYEPDYRDETIPQEVAWDMASRATLFCGIGFI